MALAALAGVYYTVNYRKPMKEIVYMDFLNNYLLTSKVKEIKITKDQGEFFNVDLIRDNKKFGGGSIDKKEIDKYLDKLKDVKEHELDIIDRLEKEISDKKEKLKLQKSKRRK